MTSIRFFTLSIYSSEPQAPTNEISRNSSLLMSKFHLGKGKAFYVDIDWPAGLNGRMKGPLINHYQGRFCNQLEPAIMHLDLVNKDPREEDEGEENDREESHGEDTGPNKEDNIWTPVSQAPQTLKPHRSPMSVHEEVEIRETSSSFSKSTNTVEGGGENIANEAPEALATQSGVRPQAEPFETFQHKVIALRDLLWPGRDVIVEDLAGGGYNRIIGITITIKEISEPDTQSDDSLWESICKLLKRSKRCLTKFKPVLRPAIPKIKPDLPHMRNNTAEYILRVPHQTQLVNLQHQAALFEFANRLSASWEVPTAKYLDNTSNNPLRMPFVVQNRVPGMNLDQLWDNLNQQQKISLGKEIGKVFRDISKHSVFVPGTIDPTSITEKSGTKLRVFEHVYGRVVKVDGGIQKLILNEHVPATRRWPVLDVHRSRFESWKVVNRHPLYPDIGPYTKLTRIAEEIESSWSLDHRFFISHNDFYPRNIMAWVHSESEARITGVVYWDLVDIAPAVVAFQPPWWVWKYDQYWDEHDNTQSFGARNTTSRLLWRKSRSGRHLRKRLVRKSLNIPETRTAVWRSICGSGWWMG